MYTYQNDRLFFTLAVLRRGNRHSCELLPLIERGGCIDAELCGMDTVFVTAEAHGIGHHQQPLGWTHPGSHGPEEVGGIEDVYILIDNDAVLEKFEAAKGHHQGVLHLKFILLMDGDGTGQIVFADHNIDGAYVNIISGQAFLNLCFTGGARRVMSSVEPARMTWIMGFFRMVKHWKCTMWFFIVSM